MPSINVMINEKNYRVACDDGQEAHLENLASSLDRYVYQLKGSFGDIGDQRLVVMAGLMIIDEMLELRKRLETQEHELAQLRDASLYINREKQAGDEELTRSINIVTKKIEQLNNKISA